ncbi:MAG: type 1 glutamine amidotransferase [Pseudanabaenaceae cyanobacterium SKYGB_i_bin29]|nr:type 1 glutamine amidotransferase [Pseudanabaenaceae cyanobacterium SKYG29]MDW8420320.1 type 1 glutamine amidotransferase [Pseudanabaenaceae cyanobacterium SKYGB_i_bin29]
MRIHYLQHVPFEGLGSIETWATDRGYTLCVTRLYQDDPLPNPAAFDWLIVLGGPMNIYEEDRYPWLRREKEFIGKAIGADKVVIGICLGAQLLADVLGGRVEKNREKEIGWFPVQLTATARTFPPFANLPQEFMAFHWHGDTFTIPPNCTLLASSAGCLHQAFSYGNKVLGLQFHLESTPNSVQALVNNCSDELVPGKYIQSPPEMMGHTDRFRAINRIMAQILSQLAS